LSFLSSGRSLVAGQNGGMTGEAWRHRSADFREISTLAAARTCDKTSGFWQAD